MYEEVNHILEKIELNDVIIPCNISSLNKGDKLLLVGIGNGNIR